MATTIHEACLDENGVPNETATRIQAALDVKGCLCINRPGGRCKAKVTFDATKGWIACSVKGSHGREAWDKPFGKVVFKVIHDIWAEDDRVRTAAVKRETRERAERKAAEEAEAFGTGPSAVHDRPDGCAPDGTTWSYSRGEWVDEHFLQGAKRRRLEPTGDTR